MSKPRISTTRELYGILGKLPDRSQVQREWNRYFTAKNLDATLTYYPATEATLPERLSEMYHFDRRAYIVGSALNETIMPYMDCLHASAAEEGRVNLVVNRNGALEGRWVNDVLKIESVIQLIGKGE